MSSLEPWFLEILACPVCQEGLTPSDGGAALLCSRCLLVYPIEDGIPQLLPDSGRPVQAPGEPAKPH
jgi:uncharacterized protein